MDEDYERTRSEFVEFCCSLAPPIKQGERLQNAGAEFDDLVRTGKFLRVVVSEGHLLAKTRDVRIRHKESMYVLGEYLLDISRGSFYAFNLTRQVGGMHGPHINSEGCFCMPEGAQEIRGLIADGHLAEALETVESALWIHGKGTPYLHASLELWPQELGSAA